MANILSPKLVTLAFSSALVFFLSLSVSSGPTISEANSIQKSKTCRKDNVSDCEISQDVHLFPFCWKEKCIYCPTSLDFRAKNEYAEECTEMDRIKKKEQIVNQYKSMDAVNEFLKSFLIGFILLLICILLGTIGGIICCCFCCDCCPGYQYRQRRNEQPAQMMMVNPNPYPAYPQYPYGNPGQPQFQNQYAAPPPSYIQYPTLMQPVQGGNVMFKGPVQQPVQQQNADQNTVQKAKS